MKTATEVNAANAKFHGRRTKDALPMNELAARRAEGRTSVNTGPGGRETKAPQFIHNGKVFATQQEMIAHAKAQHYEDDYKSIADVQKANDERWKRKAKDSGPLTRAERKEANPHKLSQRINQSLRGHLAQNLSNVHARGGRTAAAQEHTSLKKFDK